MLNAKLFTYRYTHTNIHTYKHTHIHTYKHTHTHTHREMAMELFARMKRMHIEPNTIIYNSMISTAGEWVIGILAY